MSSRADTAPVVVALWVVIVGGGCIQRYAAPTEPAEVTPYASVVSWKGLELPPARAEPTPLPEAALRLAIGPTAADLYVDAALIDGPGPGAESWPEIERFLSSRSEPIVLLLDARLPEVPCRRLETWASRVVVAVAGDPEPTAEPLHRWCPG
jgi:hypothetical protein